MALLDVWAFYTVDLPNLLQFGRLLLRSVRAAGTSIRGVRAAGTSNTGRTRCQHLKYGVYELPAPVIQGARRTFKVFARAKTASTVIHLSKNTHHIPSRKSLHQQREKNESLRGVTVRLESLVLRVSARKEKSEEEESRKRHEKQERSGVDPGPEHLPRKKRTARCSSSTGATPSTSSTITS